MQLLKNLYGYFIYVAIMILFWPLMLVIYFCLSYESAYPFAHRVRCWWAKASLVLAFYFYKVEWQTKIDKKRNYIICFNHTSHLDILLLFAVLHPMFIRFMAKAELGKLPIFGKFFRTIDISVDREDADGARKAYVRADQALHLGHSIAMAPEGGTSKNPPHLREFKTGAFRLAIEHKVPILVLTFYDNWRILPSSGKKQGWHFSRVKVHEPIETAHLTSDDYKMLSDKVRTMMQTDLEQAFPDSFKK
jgi:1-acyl-sn-glycerol-3-phosphate acyltransferase